MGIELRVQIDRVAHRDAGAVVELERSGRHDLLPRLDAIGDRHEIAARPLDANELLAGLELSLEGSSLLAVWQAAPD